MFLSADVGGLKQNNVANRHREKAQVITLPVGL